MLCITSVIVNYLMTSVSTFIPFPLQTIYQDHQSDLSEMKILFFGHPVQHGSNPCPLHWEHRVLTTGPPGKSLKILRYHTQSYNA